MYGVDALDFSIVKMVLRQLLLTFLPKTPIRLHTLIILTTFISIILAKPTLPENYQESTWQKLKEAVIAIQTSTPITYCLEELYQAVENMCGHKMDSQLYVNLTGLAENHVKSNIKPFLAERIDKLVSNEEFIERKCARIYK